VPPETISVELFKYVVVGMGVAVAGEAAFIAWLVTKIIEARSERVAERAEFVAAIKDMADALK